MRLYGKVEKVTAIQIDDKVPTTCSRHCVFRSNGYNYGYYFDSFCSLFFHIYEDHQFKRCQKCISTFGLKQSEKS